LIFYFLSFFRITSPLPAPFTLVENPTPEADVEDIAVHAEGATLEAKDMFSHRPLPFIIGTEPFFEDEYVGLMEEEEEEEEIIEEQRAVTATETLQPQASTSAPTSAPIMSQASLPVCLSLNQPFHHTSQTNKQIGWRGI